MNTLKRKLKSHSKVIILLIVLIGVSFNVVLAQMGGILPETYGVAPNEIKDGFGLNMYKYQTSQLDFYLRESYVTLYIRKHIYHHEFYRGKGLSKLERSDFMIHRLSLMYKKTEYPEIIHQPVINSSIKLKNYQSFLMNQMASLQYLDVFHSDRPLDKVMRNAMFQNPHLVEYVWNDIPDVSHIGRRKLRRRAVEKTIEYLMLDTFDTKPSLKKIIIEESPWKLEGTENIQLSQGYLKNWAKGGESSINLNSDLRLIANYAKGKHNWDNYIIHKIGVLATQDERSRVNDDLIEINTKYGLKSSEKWYYSFLYNVKTQFFYGYESSDKEHLVPISGFMAPGYMSFALGMDYKPNEKFTLLLSPLTSRLTIVADNEKFNPEDYGVDKGKNVKALNGVSIVNNFKYQLAPEISIASKFDLFYEYMSDGDDEKQVQIDWEVIFDLRINRFLSTRILGNLRYFTNESDKLQIKENFNIAFKYNF